MAQPSTVGNASTDLQRQVAVAAAQAGAKEAAGQAKVGLFELKAYIQENPTSIKVLCLLVGITLIVFSALGLFNVFDAAFEPGEYLSNLYNLFFGIIICICDSKASWMEKFGDIQNKLFKYCYFLGTMTGRAVFYFYVGSMTLMVLPDSWFWKIVYIGIGGALAVLAVMMLVMDWCGDSCGCKKKYGQMEGPVQNEGSAV